MYNVTLSSPTLCVMVTVEASNGNEAALKALITQPSNMRVRRITRVK